MPAGPACFFYGNYLISHVFFIIFLEFGVQRAGLFHPFWSRSGYFMCFHGFYAQRSHKVHGLAGAKGQVDLNCD